MGILSRLATFFRIKTSATLDKAEDPGQIMDYSYNQQREQLQKISQSIVEVATNEKRLEIQQTHLQQQVTKLEQQALQALQLQREDLARLALEKKEALVSQLASYEPQIAQLRDQKEKLIVMERQVANRVDAFRTQKEMVKAQYSAAQAQVKINEAVTGISQEMSEMNLAMQRAQDKVLAMQARAEAMNSLIEHGTLGEQGLIGTSGDHIDRELQKISAQSNVEAQLQALKQQLQLNGPTNAQKQIEGPASNEIS